MHRLCPLLPCETKFVLRYAFPPFCFLTRFNKFEDSRVRETCVYTSNEIVQNIM